MFSVKTVSREERERERGRERERERGGVRVTLIVNSMTCENISFGRKKMVSNETKKLNVELLDVFRGGTKAGGGDHFQVLLKAAKEES